MQNKIDIKEFEKNAFSVIDDFFSEDGNEEELSLVESDLDVPEDREDLAGLILGLEWEFSEENINSIIELATKSMESEGTRDAKIFYTIIINICSYFLAEQNNAHPQTFQLLKGTFSNFERYRKISSHEDKRKIIETTVTNYKTFKSAILKSAPPQDPSARMSGRGKSPTIDSSGIVAQLSAIIDQRLSRIEQTLEQILQHVHPTSSASAPPAPKDAAGSGEGLDLSGDLISDSIGDMLFDAPREVSVSGDIDFQGSEMDDQTFEDDGFIESEYVVLVEAGKIKLAIESEKLCNTYKLPVGNLKSRAIGEHFKLREAKSALMKLSKNAEGPAASMSDKELGELTVRFVKTSEEIGKFDLLVFADNEWLLVNCSNIDTKSIYLPERVRREQDGSIMLDIAGVGEVKLLSFTE